MQCDRFTLSERIRVRGKVKVSNSGVPENCVETLYLGIASAKVSDSE